MAVLRFPDSNTKFDSEQEIRAELAALGIDYEKWSLDRVGADAQQMRCWTAYAAEIDEMKRRGGYVTADVIDVNPQTPGLDAMLASSTRSIRTPKTRCGSSWLGVGYSF